MQRTGYLYSFSYDKTESELCKLESRFIFEIEENDKRLFSKLKVEPSNSAFVKRRLEILTSAMEYDNLILEIQKLAIRINGFKVEYLMLAGDPTAYPDRLSKLKDVGYSIDGEPDYYHPTITYAICLCGGFWYFGVLAKNNYAWKEHQKKPRSYSNSIHVKIAKALVNIAANANMQAKLIDACCGVGTIMLEACFAGYAIDGCDINWKVCKDSRENLAYYNYTATVYRADIKDINQHYDAAIIDLPYNLLSRVSDGDIFHILQSSAKIARRLVIVSTADISDMIRNVGYIVIDYCTVRKSGKTSFKRKIWVCEKAVS